MLRVRKNQLEELAIETKRMERSGRFSGFARRVATFLKNNPEVLIAILSFMGVPSVLVKQIADQFNK